MTQKQINEDDFYIDDQGMFVFTEKYHLEKGFCCGLGCKHCPYNFDAVPEPKRSQLLLIEKSKT